MINYKLLRKYCRTEFAEIENFAQAAADPDETWDIHHRAETDENKTRAQLKREGRYWDRTPEELVFMKHADHMKLHQTARMKDQGFKSKCTRAGESNGMYGKKHSEESKQRISDTRRELIKAGIIKTRKGAKLSEDTKRKLSEAAKKRLSDPRNHPMYGRKQSEETKRKISETKKKNLGK